MYPHLSDLVNGLFGTDLRFPGQTFGFFVAVAFMLAYQILHWDYSDREKRGEFRLDKVKIKLTGPIEKSEVLISGLLWAILGYKLGYGLLNWELLSEYPHKVLLSTEGSVPFAILGVLLGGGYKMWEYQQKKDIQETFEERYLGPSRHLGTIVTIAFVAGILGAKFFHHLEYLDDLFADWKGQVFTASGLSYYGGLLTAGFFIARFLKKRNYNILHSIDVFAPCLIIAYAFGRIGCHLSGDGDWGIVNLSQRPSALSWLPDWLWAFDYPGNVAKEGVRMADCVGEYCYVLPEPVWPTSVYEFIMGTVIFAVLWTLRKKTKFAGQMTGVYLMFNGFERFLIEGIRVNPPYHFLGLALTQAEIIALGLMLAGVCVFVYATWVYKKGIPVHFADKVKPGQLVSDGNS